MIEALKRHKKIALQLSGGKDSLACLHLLKEHLANITVYWLNTGDAYPETIKAIEKAKEICHDFVEISGNVKAVIDTFGLPSDIVPVTHTKYGLQASGGSDFAIQDRYHCCSQTIMGPMHQRMIDDGITLIIRGQRNSDRLKSPVRSGDVIDGIEFFFPIEDWAQDQVFTYLETQGVNVPAYYDHIDEAPDCMHCTAYSEKREKQFRAKFYPAAQIIVDRRIDYIFSVAANAIKGE